MSRVGLVFDQAYTDHEMGPHHPESPQRLQAICSRLKSTGIWGKLEHVVPRPAERQWVELVHTSSYLDKLADRSPSQGYTALDPDTSMSPHTLNAAYLATGGALSAVDAIMKGDIDRAFCAVRPPGHHAEADRAMGFCFLNTIAITARYLQQQHGLQRVMIVDWDVHHGNGTQHTFYDDPSVLFVSTHQYPHYPGTGRAMETGEGKGKGTTVNIPLSGGHGDDEYREIFHNVVVPAADAFRPEFVLISSGFDAHKDDPLASMGLTDAGYGELTTIVTSIANNFANGRVVSCLEGGYHLQALAGSVEQHLLALLAA